MTAFLREMPLRLPGAGLQRKRELRSKNFFSLNQNCRSSKSQKVPFHRILAIGCGKARRKDAGAGTETFGPAGSVTLHTRGGHGLSSFRHVPIKIYGHRAKNASVAASDAPLDAQAGAKVHGQAGIADGRDVLLAQQVFSLNVNAQPLEQR